MREHDEVFNAKFYIVEYLGFSYEIWQELTLVDRTRLPFMLGSTDFSNLIRFAEAFDEGWETARVAKSVKTRIPASRRQHRFMVRDSRLGQPSLHPSVGDKLVPML